MNNLEHPIIFNGEMVRAILDGRKTQTRRVIKPQPYDGANLLGPELYEPAVENRYGEEVPGKEIYGVFDDAGEWGVKFPYGKPGDRLWVRETFAYISCSEKDPGALKRGENDIYPMGYASFDFYSIRYCATEENQDWDCGWKPSIHMPRWASRINLEITNVKVEKVQDISEEDAISEGIIDYRNESGTSGWGPCGESPPKGSPYTSRFSFKHLWNSINEKRGFGWGVNPWVWVIEFKRSNDGR